ncbi:MAG: HlyD family secretion protein [Acuticoccus sp.]
MSDSATRKAPVFDAIRRHFFLITALVLIGLFVVNQVSRRFIAYSSDAYMEADTVTLAPAVAGLLAALDVVNNQAVKAGDVLFVLDPTPYSDAVGLATANLALARSGVKANEDLLAKYKAELASAEATLDDARTTRERIAALNQRGVSSQQDLDDQVAREAQAQAARDVASAAVTVGEDEVVKARNAVKVAEAALASARYDLSQTTVRAPQDGHVVPFTARVGDYLDVGQPVLTLVTEDNWRIVVNLLEQHLAHTRAGDRVYFMLSSQPWRILEGKVRSLARGIAREPVPEATLPYVAPTTNWIRLSRRFPVEIDVGTLPTELPLYKGADARVLIVH